MIVLRDCDLTVDKGTKRQDSKTDFGLYTKEVQFSNIFPGS